MIEGIFDGLVIMTETRFYCLLAAVAVTSLLIGFRQGRRSRDKQWHKFIEAAKNLRSLSPDSKFWKGPSE